MTNNILANPSVYLAAATSLHEDGIRAFASHNDLDEVINNPNTPLGKIALIAGGDSSEYTDLEVLPEFGGRFCYRSWAAGRSTADYNQNILEMEHGSVLAHSTVSLIVTGVSRTLTHELVRHGVGNVYSQESQRYVNAEDINFVMPPLMLHFLEGDLECSEAQEWYEENMSSLESYKKWQEYLRSSIQLGLESGATPIDADIDALDIDQDEKVRKMFTRLSKRANEAARSQLPNATETRLLWTVNLRALRHFVMLRGDDPADLEIRRFAAVVARFGIANAPTVFSDIEIVPGSFGVERVIGKYHKV